MSVISDSNLKKAFGAQDVFSGITLSVPQRARIALVGPNGIGKSTLLHLLVGIEKPDLGSVQRSRGLKIGFLPQEASYSSQTKARGRGGTSALRRECSA